jgi:hypothetical protein
VSQVIEAQAAEGLRRSMSARRAPEPSESSLRGHIVKAIEILDQVETRSLTDHAHVGGAQPRRRGVIELSHVVTEKTDTTSAGSDLRGDGRDQRRLAGATRAPYDDPLARIDAKAQSSKRCDVVGTPTVQHERIFDVDDCIADGHRP